MAGWRRVGSLAALALVPLLSGCWLQVGHGPEHRRYNPDEATLTRANVETLGQVWSTTAEGVFSEPIVSGNRVYASWAPPSSQSSASAHVRALDAGSGATAWDTTFLSLGGRFVAEATPAVLAGDRLWAGVEASTFLAPPACVAGDARLGTDGSVVSSTIDTVSHSAAVEADGAVVRTRGECRGGAVTLEVLDAATAAERWTGAVPGANGVVLPAVVDGRIVVAAGSRLLAFPLTGCGSGTCEPEWTADLGVRVDLQAPVGGFGGEVFVTSAAAGAAELIAVDGGTGAELWRAPAGTMVSGVAATEDTVFVAGAESLRAFAADGCGAATCVPVWTASLGTSVRSAPVTAGDVVYVGTDGAVRAFGATGCGAPTCDAVVSLPVTGTVSALSVAQGKLFVSSATVSGTPPLVTATGYVTAFAPG